MPRLWSQLCSGLCEGVLSMHLHLLTAGCVMNSFVDSTVYCLHVVEYCNTIQFFKALDFGEL